MKTQLQEKIERFVEEIKPELAKEDSMAAVIILCAEPDDESENLKQTGDILGDEHSLVAALEGFIRHPRGKELLTEAIGYHNFRTKKQEEN